MRGAPAFWYRYRLRKRGPWETYFSRASADNWEAIGTVQTHADPLTLVTVEESPLLSVSLADMDETWSFALEHRLTNP